MADKTKKKTFKHHYLVAFWLTLITSISLIVSGFYVPPRGAIDGSILTAVGEIFLWPALALGAKALEEGRVARLNLGNKSIELGTDKDGDGYDDGYVAESGYGE